MGLHFSELRQVFANACFVEKQDVASLHLRRQIVKKHDFRQVIERSAFGVLSRASCSKKGTCAL
jgi:hypothetical protein